MEKNSPPAASSLEKQIDSFLEHFKRSASKAMEAEWCSIGGVGSSSASASSNSNSNTGNSIITTTSALTTHNSAAAITTTLASDNVSSSPVWPTARQMSFEKHQHLLQRTRSRSSVLDLNTMMMAKSTEELDSQLLLSTLREIDQHNYLYLFERCKICNVNARHLRFFRKDHIRELIPKNELGILAEFEYLLNLWQISKGYVSFNTKIPLNRENESNALTIAKDKPQIQSNTFIANGKSQVQSNIIIAREKPQVQINTIIAKDKPQIQRNIQPIVIAKKSIDLNTLNNDLQVGPITSPAVVVKQPQESLIILDSDEEDTKMPVAKRIKREKDEKFKRLAKQANTASSTTVTNSTVTKVEPCEEINYDDNKSIQALLKSHNCEHFSEISDLWEDTMKYRCQQREHLKDYKIIREFLNQWPSYKLETGYELLRMDFEYLYPQAMALFRTRWLVYKQNIEGFLEAELKDVNFIKLLKKYQLQKASINEDSSSCILIYLLHAITQPSNQFKNAAGHPRYTIPESQLSMMCLIDDKTEMDEYTKPYPCIFVVGDSLFEVQECYVVFWDLRYKLSYENCLAVCVQIFTVFRVEDPQASQCFWEFIRGYLFNIPQDKAKLNTVTKNMVNYLETAASSI